MPVPIRTILIVGAGIAGLACAGVLARAGMGVTVLDKGRHPGGRVTARERDGVTFNHGAQFAAARGQAFASLIEHMQANGSAASWPAAGHDGKRVAFLPDMSALPACIAAEAVANGATIEQFLQVVHLQAGPDGWHARTMSANDTRPGAIMAEGGTLAGPFDAVILAIPSVQAAPLLSLTAPDLANAADKAVIAPCWAATVRFPNHIDVPDVIQSAVSPIAWATREAGRPGVISEAEAWTLHASSAWSRANLEETQEHVGAVLLAAFEASTGAQGGSLVFAHRWRYALVETPVGVPHLWDAETRIGACGDWCIGGRIEAAFDSGRSLGQTILRSVN